VTDIVVNDANREEVIAALRDERGHRWQLLIGKDGSDQQRLVKHGTWTRRIAVAIEAIEAGATRVDPGGRYGVVINGWLTISPTSHQWRYRTNAKWVKYHHLPGLLKKLVTDKS